MAIRIPVRDRAPTVAFEDAVQFVRFVKGAQDLGFTLVEVEQLLQLRDDRVSSCDEAQALVQCSSYTST